MALPVPRSPSLRELVERLVAPELQAHGFAYEPDRIGAVFRRVKSLPGGTVVQIVEFQFGVKPRTFGKFTVNLGVYSSELTRPARGVSIERAHSGDCMLGMLTRLSHIRPPCPAGAPVSYLSAEAERQSDEWWSYRGRAKRIEKTFSAVVGLLEERAEPWFQEMTTVDAFRQAAEPRRED
jgi:hypothetical protein